MASFKRQSFLFTLGLLLSLASQYIILLFLIRYTGFSEAGIFSLVITLVNIFQLIAHYNMRTFQVADGYKTFNEASYVNARIYSIGISFFVCIFFTILFGYERKVVFSVFLLLAYKNFGHFCDAFYVQFQLKNRLDICGICSSVDAIIYIISFIVTYFFTQSLILSFLMSFVICSAFSIIYCLYMYKKIVAKNMFSVIDFNSQRLKEGLKLLRICFPLLITGLLNVLFTSLSKLVLKQYFSDAEVGIFASLSTPTVLVSTVAFGFFVPFVTYFSSLVEKREYRSLITKVFQFFLVFSGCLIISLVLFYFFGSFCFELLYGKEILQYIDAFWYLLCGVFVIAFSNVITQILVIMDDRNFLCLSTFILVILSLPIYIYFIKTSAYMGASVATLITYFIQFFMVFFRIVFICSKEKSRQELRT